MELKPEFFCIFLVTSYLVDVGEALSDDKDEKSVEREKHRWTNDEEIKLIFIDMLTDTGERNHIGRIIEEWHKEYPESNVTDMALRKKIQRIRGASLERGGKKKFKWNPKLEQELVDVYHTTRPYMKDANVSLEEEWKRRHSDYQATGTYLIYRVRKLFSKYKYLRYRTPGSSMASSLFEDPVVKLQRRWTEHEKARLLHFKKVTSEGERTKFDEIRSMWHKEFPESKVTDAALRLMLQKLQQASRKKGKRRRFLSWTSDEEKMLLDTYLNTYPYRKDVNVTFGEIWKERQEGNLGLEKYLISRARKLLRVNKYPEYSARAFSEGNFQLDDRNVPQHLDTRRIEIREDTGFPLRESKRESQAGPSKVRGQKRNKLLPKIKKILGGRKEAESEKRFGKAPLVYSSEESASFSSPITSEDSE